MAFAIIIALASLTYVTVNIIHVLIRNIKAHQFFKTRSPSLPVVPNKSILSGHLYDVVMHTKNFQTITRLHEQHGSTFGYYCTNTPWVSTKDLDLIKLIELDEPAAHIIRPRFLDLVEELNDAFSFAQDADNWRRRRRVMAPAFTSRKVRSEEVVAELEANLKLLKDGIDSRIRDVDGEQFATIDADDMFGRFSLSVIFSVFYQRNGEINFRADKDFWAGGFDESNRALLNPVLYMSIIFPFTVPFLRYLMKFIKAGRMTSQLCKYIVELSGVDKAAREKIDRIRGQAGVANNNLVEQSDSKPRAAVNGYKRRMVDPVIDALLDNRINRHEFTCDLYLILFAGSQTTADTITCLAWHLAMYPQIQERLRTSIMDAGIDCEYLDWCVRETIRIHPAVPLGVGRILGRDVTVNGLFLPKGTCVMPSIYSIHHDPNIWPEPEEFKPERWRDASGRHPAAFMGFGLGPRNCIGSKFAVHEIKMLIQMLLTNYRLEKSPATPDEYAFSSPLLAFTYPDQPIEVRFVALNNNNSDE